MREGKTNTGGERILAFDLMRGYFLVSILLNHLERYPNLLDWWAMRGWLFVSAAEGFFAVSGIILGIVRGAKLKNASFWRAARMLWSRGLLLYGWYVGLTLVYTLVGWFFVDNPGLKDGLIPLTNNPAELLWNIATFQVIYGWADFLRFYALFLFAAPFALFLLRSGQWFPLLFASTALWAFAPFLGASSEPLKWQILFFGGFVVGYHWYDMRDWWARHKPVLRRASVGSVMAVAVVTLALNVMLIAAPNVMAATEPGTAALAIRADMLPVFDKPTLAPARLGLFIVWFTAALLIVRRYETQIVRAVGWLLLPLGRNSLYVYIIHGFLVFAIGLAMLGKSVPMNIALSFGSIALIWLMVRYRVLFRLIPR